MTLYCLTHCNTQWTLQHTVNTATHSEHNPLTEEIRLKTLDLQIRRFSRQLFWVTGTPFTHVKTCLQISGLPRKRVWYVGESCANLLEVLAVVIMISPIPPSGPFMSACRSLLRENRALLGVYMALLREYRWHSLYTYVEHSLYATPHTQNSSAATWTATKLITMRGFSYDFKEALLQKRPMILRSLLYVATPYTRILAS